MSTACISKIPAAALERFGHQPREPGSPKLDAQRRELVKLINASLLDYQHHSLQTLQMCVQTLLVICTNAATREEKYQQVRASNPALQKKLACKAAVAQDILGKAGWTQQTIEHEKYYVMKNSQDGRLAMAVSELAKASSLLQEKLQRDSSASSAMKSEQAAYRDQVLANVEDDRRSRQGGSESESQTAKFSDPETLGGYRDRKLGPATVEKDWKQNQSEYVPIHYDNTMQGARDSYEWEKKEHGKSQ